MTQEGAIKECEIPSDDSLDDVDITIVEEKEQDLLDSYNKACVEDLILTQIVTEKVKEIYFVGCQCHWIQRMMVLKC